MLTAGSRNARARVGSHSGTVMARINARFYPLRSGMGCEGGVHILGHDVLAIRGRPKRLFTGISGKVVARQSFDGLS